MITLHYDKTSKVVVCELGVLGHLGPKRPHQEKLAILTKTSNNISLSCIIFCAETSKYSRYTYCLQEEYTRFSLEVLGQFGLENPKQKVSNIHKIFLNYTNFS